MSDQMVTNALSPEEKPILENIVSLIQQLLSMQGAEQTAPMEEAIPENMPEEPVDVTKSAENETGDDDAETRINNVTPTTDLSLQELNKSITTLAAALQGNNVVKKSMPTQTVKKSATEQALVQVVSLLQNVVQKQQAQDDLNTQLFQALGFSDEVVKKALPDRTPENKGKPVQNVDTVQVAKDIISEVFKNLPQITGQNQGNTNPAYQHPFNQKKDVRKNLRSIAEYIHSGVSQATRKTR